MDQNRLEYQRKWRDENREKVREYQEKHREKTRQATKEYYHKNKEKWYAQQKEYRSNNREKYNDYMRRWRSKNIERVRSQEIVNERRRKYGLSPEQYENLLNDTNGKCPICSRVFGNGRKGPVVDHCHSTNVVRGLICGRCNFAEGHLETPENAMRLYEYMKKYELFYQGNA